MTADMDVGAQRARQAASSTWLTAAAGMLLLVTAVVMMICAAPRPHAGQHGNGPGNQLVSWVYLTPQARDVGPVVHIPTGVRP